MDYNMLFQIDSFFLSPVHIIMCIACVIVAYGVYYTNKTKKPTMDRVMIIIILFVFTIVTVWSVIASNKTAFQLSGMLKNNECYIVEGEVTAFQTPTILGHDSESFSIDDVFFEYSNSVEVGYSKTKATGGCVTGNGQKLRITYVVLGDRNIILKIEEAVKKN